jgi:hypothetical protein
MDAKTRKGREALQHSADALAILQSKSGKRFVPFSDDLPVDVDGVIEQNGIVVGLYEVKARNMSLFDFQTKFKSEWLVTFDKLLRAAALSRQLQLSFTAIVYLIPDRIVLAKTLWDADWTLKVDMSVKQTTTQRTVNGGSVSRANAYIDLSTAAIFRGDR